MEEVQRRPNEVCNFIKLSKLLKKLENCFQKISSEENDEKHAKKKFEAIVQTFVLCQVSLNFTDTTFALYMPN